MPNFHDDNWIMTKMQQHYTAAEKLLPNNSTIIALVLRGSQNYNLDTENSDLDTWCIYIPENPLSLPECGHDKQEHALAHGEQIAMVDIKRFCYALTKRSLFYIESLYSKWSIINPLFQELWVQLTNLKDAIINTNKPALAQSLKYYITTNMSHVSERLYPSRLASIYEVGYDKKALYTMERQYNCLKLLASPYSFAYCMHDTFNFLVIDAKNGAYDTVTANRLMRFIASDMDRLCNKIITANPVDVNEESQILLQISNIESEMISLVNNYGSSAGAL